MSSPKFPATVGACIDLLYKTREARLAIERQAEEQKAIETALSAHIQANFASADLNGAKGKLATGSITESIVPVLEDAEKFFEYIRKRKAFNLLQQRLAVTACREVWDTGKEIPGVRRMEVKKLSLTKIRVPTTTTRAKKAITVKEK